MPGEAAKLLERYGLGRALDSRRPELPPVLERPVRHQPHGAVRDVQGLDAVDGDQDIGDDGRERTGRHLGDEDLVGQLLAVRGDLTAAAHARGAPRYRFESPAVTGDGVPAGGEVERDGLQTAIGHEGAGHARVVVEVAVEVPVVRG